MTITWAYPAALLLLLLVPLYPVVVARTWIAIPFPRAAELRAVEGWTQVIARIPDILRTLLLCALVLAIAGPSTAGAIVEERREGVPVVLAIDISSSMLAQDFQPRDRISVAKGAMATFIENREHDPIGLVAFAAEALTLVPTTTHRPVLQSALESLQVGLLEDGTAIGDGLATAVNRLRHLDGEDGVVVLLSDGESNRGNIAPLAAADAAASLGVQVFTIGIGSESVAPVPVGAGPTGFRYAELPVGLDEALLREIAGRTGGTYFRATDATALQHIYDEIDRLVPSISETARHVDSTFWAVRLLLITAILMVAEWGIRASRLGVVP